MAASGGTPKEFGHRVKSHPLMMVTSQVKMRNGVKISISFQGAISETIDFWRDRRRLAENWDAADSLIRFIEGRDLEGTEKKGGAGHVWQDVPASAVIAFLAAFREHEASRKVRTRLLADYIRKETGQGRLGRWTVLLAGGDSAHQVSLGGTTVQMVRRSWHLDGDDAEKGSHRADLIRTNHFRIRRLVNPPDEAVDLTDAERERAMTLTLDDWEQSGRTRRKPDRPSGPRIREVRRDDRGLLILYPLDGRDSEDGAIHATSKVESDAVDIPVVGFAISFPQVHLSLASTVEYVVNNIYFDQEVLAGPGPED
jgi:hypothetical protein